jgi:hypothetical protein
MLHALPLRMARRPARARALLCVVAFAIFLATTLGLVHRTMHNPDAAEARGAHAVAVHSHSDHAPRSLVSLFGYHTDADCRLYDQLAHGPAALCVPPLFLPVSLPAATFAFLEGEAIARWVVLFDARGPPSTR